MCDKICDFNAYKNRNDSDVSDKLDVLFKKCDSLDETIKMFIRNGKDAPPSVYDELADAMSQINRLVPIPESLEGFEERVDTKMKELYPMYFTGDINDFSNRVSNMLSACINLFNLIKINGYDEKIFCDYFYFLSSLTSDVMSAKQDDYPQDDFFAFDMGYEECVSAIYSNLCKIKKLFSEDNYNLLDICVLCMKTSMISQQIEELQKK